MINGIINIYKEKGFTSHDVVAKLRGITRQKKIGHTGTLDPDAEGVLPVCLGRATKICNVLTDKDKVYEATLLLGVETDTQDVSGRVVRECDTVRLTKEMVERCVLGYIGGYMQVPPMYSALKVNGKKLYELAREGKEVERKARKVTIYDIRVLEMDLPRVRMEVHCSKGTYIRTLCHDVGTALGCGGCMESLLRTRVSRFTLAESVRLSQAEEYQGRGRLMELVLPVDEMFASLKEVFVRSEFVSLACNGNPLMPGQVEFAGNVPNAGCAAPDKSSAGQAASTELEAVPIDHFVDGEGVRVYVRSGGSRQVNGEMKYGAKLPTGDVPSDEGGARASKADSFRVFVGVYRYDEKKGRLVLENMFLDGEEADRLRKDGYAMFK